MLVIIVGFVYWFGCSLLILNYFFHFFYFNNFLKFFSLIILFYFVVFYFFFLTFFLPFILSHVAERVLVPWQGVRPEPLRGESQAGH